MEETDQAVVRLPSAGLGPYSAAGLGPYSALTTL